MVCMIIILLGGLAQLKLFVLAFSWLLDRNQTESRLLFIQLGPTLVIAMIAGSWKSLMAWIVLLVFLAVQLGLVLRGVVSNDFNARNAVIASGMIVYTAFYGIAVTTCVGLLQA